jgi:putative transposase
MKMLRHKLVKRGRQLVEVGPPYTSPACAKCCAFDRGNRLDQATFACLHCGHSDHANVYAARNIQQARALTVEPTLRRVGKRKQLREAIDVAD